MVRQTAVILAIFIWAMASPVMAQEPKSELAQAQPQTNAVPMCDFNRRVVRALRPPVTYSDKSGTTFDRSTADRRRRIMRPLHQATRVLAARADRAIGANGKVNPRLGRCIVRQLFWMADNRMFLGEHSAQGRIGLVWNVAGFAAVYIKVAGLATPRERKAIDRWLLRLTRNISQRWRRAKPNVARGNIYFWFGLTQTLTGIAARDRKTFQSGARILETALETVGPGGFLPREARRGKRAFYYHSYSLVPISTGLAIMDVLGLSKELLEAEDYAGYRQLYALVERSTCNASPFADLTGQQQVSIDNPKGLHGVWLTLRQDKLLPKARACVDASLGHRWLGGSAGDLLRAIKKDRRRIRKAVCRSGKRCFG